MQRREFIAAVGVVAAGAASQSNPTYRQLSVPLRIAPSPFARTARWTRIRFGSERVVHYTASGSSRATNTNRSCSRLADGRAASHYSMKRRPLDRTVTTRRYTEE
jgi:hypothetical protein